MSVFSCARRGCHNTMCNRLSQEHGYICDECYEELVASGPTTNIADFLTGYKPSASSEKEARARYNAAFPIADYEDGA